MMFIIASFRSKRICFNVHGSDLMIKAEILSQVFGLKFLIIPGEKISFSRNFL